MSCRRRGVYVKKRRDVELAAEIVVHPLFFFFCLKNKQCTLMANSGNASNVRALVAVALPLLYF
jgi:hypothetical protein